MTLLHCGVGIFVSIRSVKLRLVRSSQVFQTFQIRSVRDGEMVEYDVFASVCVFRIAGDAPQYEESLVELNESARLTPLTRIGIGRADYFVRSENAPWLSPGPQMLTVSVLRSREMPRCMRLRIVRARVAVAVREVYHVVGEPFIGVVPRSTLIDVRIEHPLPPGKGIGCVREAAEKTAGKIEQPGIASSAVKPVNVLDHLAWTALVDSPPSGMNSESGRSRQYSKNPIMKGMTRSSPVYS